MGCIKGFAKYLLFLFNFLIVVCAIILVVVGALMLKADGKFNSTAVTDFSVGGFAIAVGVIIFLIAFFGCCGAIKQNKCLLNTYAAILIVLLILQIVLAALAIVAIKDGKDFTKEVTDVLQGFFDKIKDNNDKDAMEIVDSIQEYYKCCGITSSADWLPKPTPNSCYPDKDSKQPIYTDGCLSAVESDLKSKIKIVAGIGISFAVVELVAAIFACMIKKD